MIHDPVLKPKITSPYGMRTLNGKEQFHYGIDFISELDDAIVFSILPGTVCYDVDYYEHSKRWSDKKHSAGNYVIIRHQHAGALYFVRYLHLKRNFCYNGQKLEKGEPIGEYGDVGFSFGPHLHQDAYDNEWNRIDISFMYEGKPYVQA